MPRVQRSLSAKDLYQRYREAPSQQEEIQAQNAAGISAPPPPSPPPPIPRDFETLRHRYRPISPQPVRQPLSPRLPDPPIFTGTNSVPFDDWKMRIQDKLTHNGDHFLTDAFKIAYVVARLGGEASHHVSTRRRYRSYSTTDVLLDHLSNIYEVPLSIIRQTHQRTYRKMSQGSQPFLKFYGDFMICAEHESNFKDTNDIVRDLQQKSELRLCDALTMCGKNWTIPQLKENIMRKQLNYQEFAEELAEKKAKRFAEQYAKAKAEADAKKGKYSIVARPNVSDSEGLDIDEAYERGCENWANAQKYGKYSRSDMDIDEAFELSCQGYL